jgi:hypothetical protein
LIFGNEETDGDGKFCRGILVGVLVCQRAGNTVRLKLGSGHARSIKSGYVRSVTMLAKLYGFSLLSFFDEVAN